MNKKWIKFFLLFSMFFYILFIAYFSFTIYSIKKQKTKEIIEISHYINTQIESIYSIDQTFTSKYFSNYINTLFENNLYIDGIIIDAEKDELQFIHLRNDNLLNDSSAISISQGITPTLKSVNLFHNITKYSIKGKNNKIIHITLIFKLFDRQTLFPVFKKALILLLSYFVIALTFFLAISDTSSKNRENSKIKLKSENNLHNYQDNKNYSEKVELNKNDNIQKPEKIEPTKAQNSYGENRPPIGMYSDISGLVWGNLLSEKLSAELKRATSLDQDNCLVMLKINKLPEEISCKDISDIIIEKFQFKDLAFEMDENAFCVILPEQDINEGQNSLDDFMRFFHKKFSEYNLKLYAGITSRNGRMVSSETMIEEAKSALEKAEEEDKSTTIAFRADLTKYREWLSKNDED